MYGKGNSFTIFLCPEDTQRDYILIICHLTEIIKYACWPDIIIMQKILFLRTILCHNCDIPAIYNKISDYC